MSYSVLFVGGPAHGEIREVADLTDQIVYEAPPMQAVTVTDGDEVPDITHRPRQHFYTHREMSCQDRDGTQFRLRVFLHASLHTGTESLRLQMVLAAMIRFVPVTEEVAGEPWVIGRRSH